MGAPTLIVGLGGIGGNVVQRLSDRIKKEGVTDVELVVMDTDVNDLRRFKEAYPNVHTVQTSPAGTVGKALDHNRFALEQWFPVNDGLTGKPFTEGAGQVRAVSRLAFDHAVEQGYMENLEKAIAKLHGLTGDVMRQEMRIILVGSIAGGTGSGLVLPAAMYIRNFLITRYQDSSAIIRGFFLEPDVVFGRLLDETERNTQRANAYAALRELNAFFRKEHSGESDRYKHVVFNAPQPGLGERMDYPNILPYNYVFLMDALNEKGDSLTDALGRYDLDAYKQHAADCIYAMALSPVSARTNSSEDNMIRAVAASGGLSRYCGAGSSCLEYPKDVVQRYIALNWADQNISGEWLEIDEEYERMVREDPELELSRFYRSEFDGKRTSNSPFYKTIFARSETRGQDGEIIDRVEEFVDALAVHAKSWATEQLYQQSNTLFRARYDSSGNERLRMLTSDADAILEQCRDTDDAAGMMTVRLTSFFDNARNYSRAALEEVADLAKGAAHSSFTVGEYEDAPLEHRDKDWQLEHIFRTSNSDGTIGSFHPAAVRNSLYRVIDLLEERRKDAEENAQIAKNQMARAEEDDYYDGNEGKDDVNAAVGLIFASGNDSGKRKLPLPFLGGKSGAIGAEEAEQLASISGKLNRYKKRIEEYIQETVACAFYEQALNYAKGLSNAYEAFYKHMGKEIERIRIEISTIENEKAYNQPKGRSHRYVCADKGSLDAMRAACFMKGSSGDLPGELCGNIYEGLLQLARRNAAKATYGERNNAASELFQRLFQEVVIKYWTDRVLDPRQGYPQIVDKSIVQAMADEIIYRKTRTEGVLFRDRSEEIEVGQSYINRTLEEAQRLSCAFIEPPANESPRPIRSCAYSAAAFDNAGAYADTTSQQLANSYNGTQVEPRDFSKYEIQFYSSLYGLRADNLPKYAPEHRGMENRPEGEYHRAYFATINQLSPNLKDNKLITPHIDKNWHLVSCLPDLNEGNERIIRHNIVRSYLYSLIFRQLGSEVVIDSDDVFYLKATEGRLRTRLWVSNGTPCDRFYEVFDALKFSPPAVEVLLASAAKRREAERNRKLALTIEGCDLLANIKSRAFTGFDAEAWKAKILDGIANREAALESPDLKALTSRFNGGAMDSTLVTNLFFFGSKESELNRDGYTSLFDIPLLYRVSLPQTETQEGEIDLMIESIFRTVEDYLATFTEGADLVANCCQLFEEQYLLFEWNLIGYESVYPTVYANQTVSSIREKVHSYLEAANSPRFAHIDLFQPTVQDKWNQESKKAR